MKGRFSGDRLDEDIMPASEGVGRPRRRPAIRFVAGAVIVCALAFLVGFGVFASHVSRMAAPGEPRNADGIVVLTGGQARIGAAVNLLKAGKGKRLLISGVNPVARADDLRLATGGDPDLFTCCVDIDRVALDTIGNAEESAKWVNANAFASIILVTNNYHMPRSLLEMRRLLGQADLHPYPVVTSRLDDGAWLTKPDALRVLFTEYAKYVAALFRTFLTPGHADADFQMVHATPDGEAAD